MLYLDSSALMKRYVAEQGTDLVLAAVRADPYVATSLMSAVEVRAALAAAARASRIPDVATYRRLVGTCHQDWARYIVIVVDAALIDSAGDLAERHALRAYDAVQLASALVAAASAATPIGFGTFDVALRRAAAAEGLPLLF